MRISQLEDRRVALWGWGREGRAAYHAIRRRLPTQRLVLFCQAQEVEDAQQFGDAHFIVETEATVGRLAAHDIVIKSPGISAYRPELLVAAHQGTRFVGGTALWFAEHPHAATICVTGTKGKSTTAALVAHLLRARGYSAALAGNIGMPLLDLPDSNPSPEFWVIELSSYQTRDVAQSGVRPKVAVVINIFPEHLDWHGSEQCYVDDKLALLTHANPRYVVLNANDPMLASLDLPESVTNYYGRSEGWHLRGDILHRGDRARCDLSTLPLTGRHNRENICAALTVIDTLGLDATAHVQHLFSFMPLPNRLQTLGQRDGLVWVNDSISTTPHASLAALEVFAGQRVALLIGGHDRGIDWTVFSDAMELHAPAAIVTMGDNGPKINALLDAKSKQGLFQLSQAQDLVEAVAQARAMLGGSGVVLLSPGAPSFGQYRDYTQRGKHFAQLAGFDAASITDIPGLGVS